MSLRQVSSAPIYLLFRGEHQQPTCSLATDHCMYVCGGVCAGVRMCVLLHSLFFFSLMCISICYSFMILCDIIMFTKSDR